MASVASAGLEVMTMESLVPLYGADGARRILQYWSDFEVFSDGFLPVQPTIVENNGTKLVLLRCPLNLTRPPAALVNRVCLGVLFTPNTTRPPVCALLLDPNSRLAPPPVPWLGSNMTVKVNQIPSLADLAQPALMDLLLAVTTALNETPMLETPMTSASPPPPIAPVSPATMPPPGPPSPSYSAGSPSTVSAPPAQPGTAAAVLESAAANAVSEFILLKEQCVRRQSELTESRHTLEKLQASLQDKERLLSSALPKLAETEAQATALIGAAAQIDPLGVLEAPDVLRRQGVELLAEIMALEDLLDLYEKRLRRGTIQIQAYLRLVADAARRQFLAKYKLKKLHGIANAKQSLLALVNRFPQLDRDLIQQVLAEHNYVFAETARRLSEMVQSH